MKVSAKEQNLKIQLKTLLIALERKGQLSFLRVVTGKFKALNYNREYYVGRKGFADWIIFLKGGKTLFIELKAEGKSLKPDQKEFQKKVTELNYEYHIINSIGDMRLILMRDIKGVL